MGDDGSTVAVSVLEDRTFGPLEATLVWRESLGFLGGLERVVIVLVGLIGFG